MLMQVVFLVIAALARVGSSSSSSNLALPGCNDTCGNISVPYPFGMGISSVTGKNCYLDDPFQLFCGCFDKPEFLCLNSHTSILNISLQDGQFETQSISSKFCYNDAHNNGSVVDEGHPESMLSTGPFPISSKENKLVTIGCDSYGYLYSTHDGVQYSAGCLTRCDYGFADADKQALMMMMDRSLISCMGVGCCEVDVPPAAIMRHYVVVRASSFDNFTNSYRFNNCTYSFIAKKGSYSNFTLSQLGLAPDEFFNKNLTLPLVVDWSVGNSTCEEASSRNGTQYYCRNNSFCDDTDTVNGYRCRCKDGFDGNPYHPNGCIDIDECKTSQHNCISENNCVNTYGSYACFCPKGQSGTGTKEGGCHQQNKLEKAFIGVSSSGGSIILILALWGLHKIVRKRMAKKRKEKFYKRNGGLLLDKKLSYGEVNVDKAKHFTLKNLEKATDNFNVNRVLGKGGQGTVYKGMLSDGQIVAVKKFKVEGNIDEFINEFLILSQINHRNVVNLLGCCLEAEIPLLVYEFIANGTLSEYLHEQNEDLVMTWEVRLRIASEVAGALFYLHSAASRPIYHRDIKSSNILLDEKYRAKVADFGTSRMVSTDDTHLTTIVQGTFGYLDPEYFHTSQFTEKSDVYSFGVVLVELLTGQRVLSSTRSEESKSLASYFLYSMEENKLFDIIDERFKMEIGRKNNDIFAVANLAARCLELNGKNRPSMRDVAMELERIRKLESNTSIALKKYEETEICGIEEYNYNYNQPWDAFSSTISTGSTQKSTTGSSIEVMPILNTPGPGYVSP